MSVRARALLLNCSTLVLEGGASLNADGLGSASGIGPGAGYDDREEEAGSVYVGTGAAHGGWGGSRDGRWNMNSYGSAARPAAMGSKTLHERDA